MREILFRGQHIKYGQKVNMAGKKLPSVWVYGGIFPSTGDYSIIYGGKRENFTAAEIDKWPVYSETVGQYTGLTDKNGEKIFEGDIVEGHCHSAWSHRLQRCEVAYGRDGFEARNHIDGLDSDYYTYRVLFSKDVVVIGNIHDNPELLTQKNI